jgi:tetratricopeptide (TPR) repeat protein
MAIKNIRLPVAVLIAAWTALSGSAGYAYAQDDGGGRSVFAYGAGNRPLALGGAYSAIANDASAPMWNPGGLGLIQRSELQVSHISYYSFGIDEQFGSMAFPNWKWGTFTATVRHFGVDDIEHRDGRNVLVEDGLSDSESELLFGYGRGIGEAWSVGGALKVRHHSLAGRSGSGVGMDVGVIVKPLFVLAPNNRHRRRLSLGLAVRNAIEPKIQLENERVPDPTGVRLGAAMYFPFFNDRNLLASVDLEKTRDMDVRYHLGFELVAHPLLAVRLGINNGMLASGAGVNWHGVTVDYTYEDAALGGLHSVGASFVFGQTVVQSRTAALNAQEAELQARLAAAFEKRQSERVADLLARASSAQRAGNYNDALRLIAVARTLDPENVNARLGEAVCLRNLAERQEADGDYASAAVTYSRALSITPGDAEASAGYDRCRLASDRQAARSVEIRARFAAALDAFGTGDLAAARDGFSAISNESPSDVEAAAMLRRTEDAITHSVDATVVDANRLIDWGVLDEADELLVQARSLRPDDAGVRDASRRLTDALSKRETAALQNQAGGGKVPDPSGTGGNVMGGAAAEIGDEQRREADRLYARGVAAMTAHREEEAIQYFELVWSIDPKHKGAVEYLKREYLMRGMEFFADGRLGEAVAIWEEALRVDPNDERVHGYLTRAREQIARTRQILGSNR